MNKPVVWSETAKKDLLHIKSFFDERNGSASYSNKLLKTFRNAAHFIERHPMASKAFNDQVRGFILAEYIIFFQIMETHILILTIWDGRRDPNQLLRLLGKKK